MNLLLDTQALLWWREGHARLGRRARHAIEHASTVVVSAASIWEIVIKAGIGRLKLKDSLQAWSSDALVASSLSQPGQPIRHRQVVSATHIGLRFFVAPCKELLRVSAPSGRRDDLPVLAVLSLRVDVVAISINVGAMVAWLALLGGAIAAAAACYGHYRTLPAWMTGPEICRLEDGGCAVLFRSPRASLLGVPNAALGLILYALLGVGLVLGWPAWVLLVMTVPALAMSAFLGYSLLANRRECRICWTGHLSNAVLFLTFLVQTLNDIPRLSS